MTRPYQPSCLCCGEPTSTALCKRCAGRGCTFFEEKCHVSVLRAIEERRADSEFMARLRERIAQDAPLMARMSDGECKSARLIGSKQGGEVLIYECECGQTLHRTRAQAEAAAMPVENGSSPIDAPAGTVQTPDPADRDGSTPPTWPADYEDYIALDYDLDERCEP